MASIISRVEFRTVDHDPRRRDVIGELRLTSVYAYDRSCVDDSAEEFLPAVRDYLRRSISASIFGEFHDPLIEIMESCVNEGAKRSAELAYKLVYKLMDHTFAVDTES